VGRYQVTANAQSVTLVAGTEQHVTWTQYFPTITVVNNASSAVFVRTDGTAASETAGTGGTGSMSVPAGQTGVFENGQPIPDLIAGDNPGLTNYTYVSLISSGTGDVTVTVE
jgi:hypothetical protein